jgi:hypothetical protein
MKVGVVRQLTYDPSIKNTRGFLDIDKNTKNNSTNIYGPAELLNSFTVRHADPPRRHYYAIHMGDHMSKVS